MVIFILIIANIVKHICFKHNVTRNPQKNISIETSRASRENTPVINNLASTPTTSFNQLSHASTPYSTEITEKNLPTVFENNCETGKIYSENCIYCHKPIDSANTIFLTNGMKLHKECYKKCLSTNGSVEKDIVGKVHAFWNGYPPDWNTRKAGVLREAGYRCEECGKFGVPLTVHHIIPLTKGGSNAFDNLKALCAQCHQRAHGGRDLTANFDATPDSIRLAVIHAIQENKKIQIIYVDYNKQQTKRIIKPIRIISRHSSYILEAFCYLRKENREFRMINIKQADIL